MPDQPFVPRRSFLFVSGLRPDMYPKALASGADCVCIDLEDAVAPARKDEARSLTIPLFNTPCANVERLVRINSLETRDSLKDIEALAQLQFNPDGIVLPKIRSAVELKLLDGWLQAQASSIRFQVVIETCDALEHAYEIAAATPRLTALLFGAVDMSADLRCKQSWDTLLYARSRVVHAAASKGLDVMDVPHLDLQDSDGLDRDAQAAAALGFTGKACIHPKQIPAVHKHFTPSAERIAQAQDIMDAFATSQDGLVMLNGKLIEKPVLREASRILAAAQRLTSQ